MTRRLAWLAAGLVLLTAAAGGLALAVSRIDPDAYEPQLVAAIDAATGRTLTLGGRLRVRWALSPTLSVTDARLANLPGGSRPDVARVERIEATIALLPLLRHRLDIVRLTLTGPNILFEQVDGKPNWVFNRAPRPTADASAHPAARKAAKITLRFRSVVVVNGMLTFHFPARTKVIGVRSLDFEQPGADGPLDLRSMLVYSDFQPFTLHATAAPIGGTRGAAAPWTTTLDASAFDATATARGTMNLIGGYDLQIAASVPRLAALNALLPQMRLPALRGVEIATHIGNGPVRGDLPVIGMTTLHAEGADLGDRLPGLTLGRLALSLPAPGGDATFSAVGRYTGLPLAVAGHVGVPMQPDRATRIPMDLTLSVPEPGLDLVPKAGPGVAPGGSDRGTAPGTSGQGTTPGASGQGTAPGASGRGTAPGTSGQGTARGGSEQRAAPGVQERETAQGASDRVTARGTIGLRRLAFDGLDATVAVQARSLGAYRAVLWPLLPDLHAVALQGRLSVAQDGLSGRLQAARLQATEAGIAGEIRVVRGPARSMSATLHATRLDVDALLAGAGAAHDGERGSAATGGDGAVFADTPLPWSVPAGPDLDVDASVERLRWQRLDWTGLAMSAHLRDGRLRLDGVHVTPPGGGAIDGAFSAGGGDGAMPVELALHGAAIPLALVATAAGLPGPVRGSLVLETQLQAAGRTPHALAASLSGPFSLTLAGGSMSDAALIRLAAAPLKELGVTVPAAGQTPIRCFGLVGRFANGVGRFPVIALDTGYLELSGAGEVDLGRETLAVKLHPLARVAGSRVAVPVMVEGTLRDIHSRLAASGLDKVGLLVDALFGGDHPRTCADAGLVASGGR